MTLTVERVRILFSYDPLTGWLVRKLTRGSSKAGTRAGSDHPNGYRYIKIDAVLYSEHRVIWLLVTGKWPAEQLDHKNRITSDNTWDNLREATQTQNMGNRKPQQELKGITRTSEGKGWQAQIAFNGKRIHLGRFYTPEEAHAAYVAKAKELFGEFARIK